MRLFLLLSALHATSACVNVRQLMLQSSIVDKLRPLTTVSRVRNFESCAQLCLRENACAAARLHASGSCDLLRADKNISNNHEHLDIAAATEHRVEVWAVAGRSFGECPESYRASGFGLSYFRLETQGATWKEARDKCHEEGGKLAEITTEAEGQAVVRLFRSRGVVGAFVGAFQPHPRVEPRGGWVWYQSGLPLSASMWNAGEPNNAGNNEHVAVGLLTGSRFLINDFVREIKSAFLCECISIG